jgi:hypothetical protein
LCQFSFADGRRCRTPRTGKHPHFCFDHAQKEAHALAEESLSKDLAYFFSGDYLSACDLSTAMGRLIPAVIRGDIKPRAARTVAYMAQILLQSIQLAQHEYTNAFGSDGWRKSIRHSVNSNYHRRFPFTPSAAEGPLPKPPEPAPAPAAPPDQAPHVVAGLQTGEFRSPQPAQAPAGCHSEPAAEREESLSSNSPLATHHSPLPPTPHIPIPPTAAEFAQQVMASLPRPDSTEKTGGSPAPQSQPTPASPLASPPASCHSERSEEPVSSSNSPLATHHSPLPQTPSRTPNKDAWQQFHHNHRKDSHLP